MIAQDSGASSFYARYSTLISAAIIGLVAMLVASLFVVTLSDKFEAQNKMHALEQLNGVKNQVERLIEQNEIVLQEFRGVLMRNPQLSDTQFRNFAQGMKLSQRYIQAVIWAPAGVVKKVYPLSAYRNRIDQALDASFVEMLEDNGAVAFDKLVIEKSLGQSLAPRLTLYTTLLSGAVNSAGNGVLSLEIEFNKFMSSSVFQGGQQGLQLAIKSVSSGNYLQGDSELFENALTVGTVLRVGGDSWRLMTLVVNHSEREVAISWLLAAIISLVLAVISYKVISIYKQRSADVEKGAYQANYDLLTGLPNRYHFQRKLGEAIEEAGRDQSDFAIFFMDIDHFKQMNDQLGHGVGDAILTEFSKRLEDSTKNTDLAARISGDEFIFVSRDVADVIKADLLAEKLKKHLQQPIEYGGQQHFITVSMGIAMYPIDGDDVESLLQHSDQAMYAAKRAGRNQHFFFNEGMREEADHYVAVHNDLLRGLGMGEFELFYQPVMNVETGTIDICEALIRWHHPEQGLVMPDKFIPIANRTGAIREIGNWAFSQACRDLRTFADVDIDVKVAINHSVSEYYSSRAFERWKRILSENSVSGDRFIFEIPEALLMDKKSIRMSVVTAMRKMGVQFAIDDFGTGHSAINYLRNYPADILKIDASLIKGMRQNDKDRTLVEVVLTLSKSLGKTVVAEGVEDIDVANELRALHCDYLQGNWLLEPVPIRRLVPYLHQKMFEHEDDSRGVGHS